MHLNGDLSDFALADILQILSLGRKTGTLLVENGSLRGRIIIEGGRITGAEAQPGGSLADHLVRRGKLNQETLARLCRIGASCPAWSLPTLLLESGLLKDDEIQEVAVAHVSSLVARLVEIGKGSFRLLLNETALTSDWDNVRIADGLDIGEVLLQSATRRDEAQRRPEAPRLWGGGVEPARTPTHLVEPPGLKTLTAAQNHKGVEYYKPTARPPANGAAEKNGNSQPHAGRFYAMLAELSANSALMEISLLVMRYASELASRGVLFGIYGDELHGIGQFGIDRFLHGRNVDGLIRGIRLPLASDSLVARVARERAPVVGPLEHNYWNAEMLEAIGGGHEGVEAMAVPLLRNGQVMYVIYADNFGSQEPLMALDELIALTSAATLALARV